MIFSNDWKFLEAFFQRLETGMSGTMFRRAKHGAEGGSRTHTMLPSLEFESSASANSATSAQTKNLFYVAKPRSFPPSPSGLRRTSQTAGSPVHLPTCLVVVPLDEDGFRHCRPKIISFALRAESRRSPRGRRRIGPKLMPCLPYPYR